MKSFEVNSFHFIFVIIVLSTITTKQRKKRIFFIQHRLCNSTRTKNIFGDQIRDTCYGVIIIMIMMIKEAIEKIVTTTNCYPEKKDLIHHHHHFDFICSVVVVFSKIFFSIFSKFHQDNNDSLLFCFVFCIVIQYYTIG